MEPIILFRVIRFIELHDHAAFFEVGLHHLAALAVVLHQFRGLEHGLFRALRLEFFLQRLDRIVQPFIVGGDGGVDVVFDLVEFGGSHNL